MLTIESNQVWASIKSNDVQRIIIQVIDSQDSVFYIEYWKDQDHFQREGFCSITQLKSWGIKVEDMVEKELLNRALDFLLKQRFERTQFVLNDLASVLVDPENRDEVLAMIDRIIEMSSQK